MWKDLLRLGQDETLFLTQETQLSTQGQESIQEWQIRNHQGDITGTVMLRNRLNSRRSYSGDYRLTQRNQRGEIVLDQLINSI